MYRHRHRFSLFSHYFLPLTALLLLVGFSGAPRAEEVKPASKTRKIAHSLTQATPKAARSKKSAKTKTSAKTKKRKTAKKRRTLRKKRSSRRAAKPKRPPAVPFERSTLTKHYRTVARWRWCKRFGLDNQACKRAYKSRQPSERHAMIRKMIAWWQERLDAMTPKQIAALQTKRARRFSVDRWWFDRNKWDIEYRLIESIDNLLQPVIMAYPLEDYREIFDKLSKLLLHKGLSNPRQTALTSRLQRWMTRRPDAQSLALVRQRMEDAIVSLQKCHWWFIVFLQTHSPRTTERFVKEKISPTWCQARRVFQEIRFHTPAESDKKLQALATQNPRYTNLVRFGESYEGRPLYALQLHNPRRPAAQQKEIKSVILVGAQHGDEHMGTELVLDLAHRLLEKKNAPALRKLLEEKDIWLIPVLNPDGATFDLASGITKYWRYNRSRHPDGQIGIDLNRNYNDNWKPFDYYRKGRIDLTGERPFSEPETDALRRLTESLPRVSAILDLHQFGRAVLLPYAHAKKPLPDPMEDLYYKIGQYLVEPNGYRTFPAHRLYPHQGTLGDWGYSRFGALSLVLESSTTVYLNPAKRDFTVQQDGKLLDRFLLIADAPFRKIKDIPLPPPDPRIVRRPIYRPTRPAQ